MTSDAPADDRDDATPGRLVSGDELSALYRARFDDADLAGKQVLWRVLCDDVFQQYVPVEGTVVDLGAGSCEFVNQIRAGRRIAVDLSPHTADAAGPGVEVLRTSSTDLSALGDGSVDTVFTSNFFEHLPTKEDLLRTLEECRRVLTADGRLVVLMPNIRYLAGRYWDYLDHHLPLTHVSLQEALELTGFRTERVVPRFLPYTVKDGRVPVRAALVRAYLRFPPAWRVMGRQMLVVARPAEVRAGR